MTSDVSSFIERYQVLYEKDPDSKVFAPLAEAYRRMGLIDEALDLAERGVRKHPHFASGRVALGKCFAQKGEYDKAVDELRVAVNLSPENLLAHQLLAQCYSSLKKPAEALNAYKMVLFLNPNDAKTAKVVSDLEAKVFTETKEEWADEDFSMEKIHEVARKANEISFHADEDKLEIESSPATTTEDTVLARELALLDSRWDRGNMDQFRQQLAELEHAYPGNAEVLKRKVHLEEITKPAINIGELIKPVPDMKRTQKIKKLEKYLKEIEMRRKA